MLRPFAIDVLDSFIAMIGWANAYDVKPQPTSEKDGFYASIAFVTQIQAKEMRKKLLKSICIGHGWWDGATLPRHKSKVKQRLVQ